MDERKPIRIFLVEGDADDCDFFKEAFIQSSLPVILTSLCMGEDLLKELSLMKETIPDIVFLDINMPKKTGHEILTEIRCIERFKNVPVIMLSTSIYKGDVDFSYKHGTNLYIPKELFFL